MKAVLLFFTMFCCCTFSHAQDSLGAYVRVKPEAVIFDDYKLEHDPNYRKAMAQRGKPYSTAAVRISEQMNSFLKGYPQKFDIGNYDARMDTIQKYLPGYHAFIVASWNKKCNDYSSIPENTPLILVEIPLEYNDFYPFELQPYPRRFFVLLSPASVEKQSAAAYAAFKAEYKKRKEPVVVKKEPAPPPVIKTTEPVVVAPAPVVKPAPPKPAATVDYNPPTGTAFKADGTNEGVIKHRRKMDRFYVTGLSTILVNVNFSNQENFKSRLVGAPAGYSYNDMPSFSYRTDESKEYPPAIRTPALREANGKLAANYNCYMVENLVDNNYNMYNLLWVPYSENLGMQKDMQPVSQDGFYLLVKPEECTFTKQPVENRTVNMNVKEKPKEKKISGAFILYYGSSSNATYYAAYIGSFNPDEYSKDEMAAQLKAKVYATQPYLRYDFVEMERCMDVRKHVAKKIGSDAARNGSCSFF
jgi:hypothetical protein